MPAPKRQAAIGSSSDAPPAASAFIMSTARAKDDNPFLEPPARKMYKHSHATNNSGGTSHNSSSASATMTTTTNPVSDIGSGRDSNVHTQGHGSVKHPFSGRGGLQTLAMTTGLRKPQRLVLTRVLPSNHTARTDTTTELAVTTASATSTAMYSAATGGPVSEQAFNLRIEDSERKEESIPSYKVTDEQQQQQHPSTTPKAPPNKEYYDFIMRGMTTSMRFEQRLQDEVNKGREKVEAQIREEQHQTQQQPQNQQHMEEEQANEQHQAVKSIEDDQEQDAAESKKAEETFLISSATMAFARKSIMQNASTSPKSIFRKLKRHEARGGASGPGPSSSSGSSLLSPSLSVIPSKDKNENGHGRQGDDGGLRRYQRKDPTIVPNGAFTFVSQRPSPVTVTAAAVPATSVITSTMTTTTTPLVAAAAKLSLRGTTETSAAAVISPSLTESTALETPFTIKSSAPVPTQPTAFSRSVLDFSRPMEPTVLMRKSTLSQFAAPTSAPSINDTVAREPRPADPAMMATGITVLLPSSTSLLDQQLKTPPPPPDSKSGLLTPLTADSGRDRSARGEETLPTIRTDGTQTQFDLRSALRMDSARTQYRLPSLIASLSPPSSPKRRPTPYTIPSIHERDTLRSRRMPQFKARPLNPKVFTSAGDLGVPRIPKQPLTVPKSPVFSQRKRVKVVMKESQLKKGQESAAATATGLKDVLGVKSSAESRQYTRGAKGTSAAAYGGQGPTAVERVAPLAKTTNRSTSAMTAPHKDQMRVKVNMGSIKGPPMRESVSFPSLSSTSVSTSISSATATVKEGKCATEATTTTGTSSRIGGGELSKAQQRTGLSKLRRPATTTRPVPFSFATTELQRRRIMFEPTADNLTRLGSTAIATIKPSTTTKGGGDSGGSVSMLTSRNGLTLEDL
ncbi:hypothetical protein EDD11_009586 [Mortierella claussenii]|nr:hypothetical protein EDD11_009586 [Mortierella claussenii]